MNKILKYVRFLIAIAVFVLCGLAFWGKFYSIKIFDFQFAAALQSGIISGLGISAVLLMALILLTLLFGRVYCSTLCPLGLYQEFLTILFTPFYKKRKFQTMKHHIAVYFLAAILFGTLFGGTVVLLRMLDPYSVAGNAMSGAWFGLGFVIALTVLVFFKKRFFCTNICPVGAVLGLISRFSLFKIRIDTDKCKMCSLCARSCPCGSIDFKNHTVDNETCVKCFKCLSYCSHGALYYGLPKTEKPAFNINRRKFITAGLVLATFGAAFKGGIELSKKMATKVKNVILPAGSGDVQDFANRCLNCNLCVQNCPMKIIKPANTKTPFVHLDYGDKYCDFNCHKCSSVCPSGAIKRMTLKEKQNTKIANAVINEDICIKCGICSMECPKNIIIKEDGEFPLIQFDKCIGCGKCANACPVKAISIEPVNKQVTLI
jgi:ferredoxin